MRAVKSVSIDSERRVIITYLDGSTETLYPNCIWCDSEALRQLIKDLLEEKADAIIQTIENVTIASFADGADEGLIKKLLVSIDPIQEGTGDPSPENVRPIVGRTGLTAFRTGKNLWGGIVMAEAIRSSAINAVTINEEAKTVTITASPGLSNSAPFSGPFKESTQYTYILDGTVSTGANMKFKYTDGTFDSVPFIVGANVSRAGKTVKSIILWQYNRDTIINYEKSGLFEGAITVAEYEPYKGNTYSVNWETEAGTVYGGHVDVVSGKLTVDRANIASYNGEVLPSTWISDRDVYAEGTSPTTGAQVVYKLATPTEIQLNPQEITTLLGDNNIWADSGNILELEYTADTKLYIGEQQSGTSGTLGSNMHTITIPDLQPVTDNTLEEITDEVKEIPEEVKEE